MRIVSTSMEDILQPEGRRPTKCLGYAVAHNLQRRSIMTNTLSLSAILLTVGLMVGCNKTQDHEGQDHASHEATAEHQMGEQHEAAAVDATKSIIPVSVSDKGFEPSRVEVKKGQDATLRFTRTSDDTCAKKVVFPDLKIEKDLPLNEAVDVKVPTDQPRELAFQCGMGMFKSAVVIN
jgi:hypothetical protein